MSYKGIFIISDNRLCEVSSSPIGVIQKILKQNEVLNKKVGKTELMNFLYKGKNKIMRYLYCAFSKKSLYYCAGNTKLKTDEEIYSFFENINFIYVRFFFPCRLGMCYLFKQIKKTNPRIRLLLEFPTYPYDGEWQGLKGKLWLMIDKANRNKLKKYVDRIVTLTDDKEIFGIPTLHITNGSDVASIPVVEPTEIDKTHIHVIAVAQFAFWHGYERFIEGMGEYYKKYGNKIGTEEYPNITLHLVGDGTEIQKYKALVDKFCLETHGLFHGTLAGEELTKVFNESSLALCSLGSHRAGIYGSSSMLKSREYLSRGLPLVSSTKIDVIPNDFPYAYYVSEDEKTIDVHSVAKWWNNLHSVKKRESIVKDIRQFAEENCTMEKAMKNVTDYLNDKILNNSLGSGGGASNFPRNTKR